MARLNFLRPNNNEERAEDVLTREELYQKIKRKSLKTLKGIIIVNILILAFFISSSFLFKINEDTKTESLSSSVLTFADYALVILPVAFTMICAYIIFKIRKNNTVEALLLNIKKRKKRTKTVSIFNFNCLLDYNLYYDISNFHIGYQ